MFDSITQVPFPKNEPIKSYAPGDPCRTKIQNTLKSMASERADIPCFIGGEEIRTGQTRNIRQPHAFEKDLGQFHLAGDTEMEKAIAASAKAKPEWERMPAKDRMAIFLRAADLLAGPYRDLLNASTMLGQSKSVFQAEIDAACELIDFFKFNALYYQRIMQDQPISVDGVWNQSDYRPLEGFVFAITPFNFTSIAANLCAAPAMVGNTVIWKPSDTQMLSAYYTMKLFKAAGLPDGVINMIGADGPKAGEHLLKRQDLAGVHFTGSTGTFRKIYQTVGQNIANYRSYPRVVGETGGKDFVFAHPSANVDSLRTALIRGAYEYQGQKCSAASRAYIPKSIWSKLRDGLVEEIKTIQMGDPSDFSNFMNAVIDDRAFKKISSYIDYANDSSDAKILAGGKYNDETGYFIEPTLIETSDAKFKTMVEEIFGPVLTVYVYDDSKLEQTLTLCDESSEYALTGAVFSQDRTATLHIMDRLRQTAGNFYINDKPTGAVVGQQPFGGARGSGTNDKAGSYLNLIRWISPRSIKETFNAPTDYRYPFMQ